MVGTGMREAPEYGDWAGEVVAVLWAEGPEALWDEPLIDDAVRIDVLRFKSWYNWARRTGKAMLAVTFPLGRRAVIPSRSPSTGAMHRGSRHEWEDLLPQMIREERLAHPDAVEVSPIEARTLFEGGLKDFMVARRKGTEELKADANRLRRVSPDTLSMITVRNGAALPGCRFTVTSNTPGLRALWSPAYGLASNAFGHPTSPVFSYLLSGTYIFGVDGGAYVNPAWDHAHVTLPGPNTSVHLNF